MQAASNPVNQYIKSLLRQIKGSPVALERKQEAEKYVSERNVKHLWARQGVEGIILEVFEKQLKVPFLTATSNTAKKANFINYIYVCL